MITPLRVWFKKNPVGSFSVQVFARNEKGEVIVGTTGGVPRVEMDKAVTGLSGLLDLAQSNVALDYPLPEKPPKTFTARPIKA